MQYAPTIIRKCSECSCLIKEPVLYSGNTFGAKYWTDGKRDAPMLPDMSWLVKCPHCQVLIWIDEQEKVGETDPLKDGDAYKDAEYYRVPKLEDYFTALKKNNLDRKKERYIRLHAWWEGNDKRRYDSKAEEKLSDEERENLQKLDGMLDFSDDNDRLMMAEIKRELGQFEDAEKILKKPFIEDFSQAASIIRELAEKRDPLVKEMKFEN